MATLKEQFQSDVDNLYLNTDDFADVIGYLFVTGEIKYINAIVDRGALATVSSEIGIVESKWEIMVTVSATDVITPVELNEYVYVENKEGEEKQWLQIRQVLDQENGMWHLELGPP